MPSNTSILDVLNKKSEEIFPLWGSQFNKDEVCSIDLGSESLKHESFDIRTYGGLRRYIEFCLQEEGSKAGLGGYAEKRNIYAGSSYFVKGEEVRCMHMGIDLWARAGTLIFAPLDGCIHSLAYNNNTLDYGGTLILQHNLEGETFHTLYGHLSRASLSGKQIGASVERGIQMASLGVVDENGGWPPHLHFQLILDMEGMEGDYPGVVSKADFGKYKQNCPDPSVFFRHIY